MTINSQKLQMGLIKKVIRFVRKNKWDKRLSSHCDILSCIHIDNGYIYATDGYKLAKIEAIGALKDLNNASIYFEAYDKAFKTHDHDLMAWSILANDDRKYPNCNKVIKTSNNGLNTLTVNKADLNKAITDLKGIGSKAINQKIEDKIGLKPTNGNKKQLKAYNETAKLIRRDLKHNYGLGTVKLDIFQDQLLISGYNKQGIHNVIRLDCHYTSERLTISFNGSMFIDILYMLQSDHNGNINLKFTGQVNPMYAENNGYYHSLFMLMPVKP